LDRASDIGLFGVLNPSFWRDRDCRVTVHTFTATPYQGHK